MTDVTLHIDFETRSVVDLKKFGLDVYSHHPSTDAWCMAYAFGSEAVHVWRRGEALPERIREHIKKGLRVVGHNVNFEWHIWNRVMKPRYGWPTLKRSQLDCTMARAYAMALPGSLDKLSQALRISTPKDMKGHALMRKMMKPREIKEDGEIIWWDDLEKFDRLCQYCMTDVEAERECDELLMPLSESEYKLWQLDFTINQRGIGVDVEAIRKTLVYVDLIRAKMDRKMSVATKGEIQRVNQAKKFLEWCKAQEVNIDSLQKSDLKQILEDPELPYEVREALEIRANSAKASVTKLETMLDMTLVDHCLRNMFQYHGATTGRFAGRGVQVHNFARPEDMWESPDLQNEIIEGIKRGILNADMIEEKYGPFLRVISSCLRGYMVAREGKEYVGADLKSIEGVTLPWLAGEEWKLEAFRKHFWQGGTGIYQLAASRIFSKPVEDCGKGSPYYLLGKVGELSMGYQGGRGAYKSMAINYGVIVADEEADKIRDDWRVAHPKTKSYWYKVEEAGVNAVKNPGGKYYAGAKGREVCFRVVGDYLFLQLPSGRCLCYPEPRMEMVDTFWGTKKEAITFMSVDGRLKSKTKGKWIRMSTYGGKLVENITQAVARDVLVEGMFRLEAAGYPIVLHVHDEAVAEVDIGFGSVEEFENIMSEVPSWAKDLPIAADGFTGKRYRK